MTHHLHSVLDHDDFGSDRRSIMNIDRFKCLARDLRAKPFTPLRITALPTKWPQPG